MKFSGKVGNGLVNQWLNFDGDPVTDPDTDPDTYLDTNLYCNTGKTFLGRGMHGLSASS